MELYSLNAAIGAQQYINAVCQQLADDKDRGHSLVGADFGSPYGGSVQQIGRIWKPVGGTIHAFDTFDGHPRQLAYSPNAYEATCMDCIYGGHSKEELTYEYQRRVLDEEGLLNVILHKGLIHDDSLDTIPYLDYALLDVDMIASMVLCWTLVRTRITRGGYLCLHDVVPRDHLVGLWGLYQEILATGDYQIVEELPLIQLAILRRK